jgi:Tol biopolymer transport system component
MLTALSVCTALSVSVGCGSSGTPIAEREEPNNIFLVRSHDGKLTRLTDNEEEEAGALHPSWSPDGRRLVFAQYACEGCPSEIHMLKLSATHGSLGRRVGTGTRPQWSPDGTKIAFLNGLDDLSVIALAGSRIHRLARAGLSDAPTGRPMVGCLHSSRAGPAHYEIRVVSLEGAVVRRLARSNHPTINPAWSPDGRMIAFARQEPNGRFQIYTVNADGTGLRVIGTGELSETSPTWSPDGSRIAFIGVEQGKLDGLYVMTADGGGLHRLTPRSLIALQPAWSPRGDLIAFAARPSS